MKLACPHCSGVLQPIRLGESRLRECDGCGGLWVDNRTFVALCRARGRERQAALAAGQPGPARPGPMPMDLPVRYRRCPVCRDLMNRVNFAWMSGVLVDVCREHGSWFEPGELQRVLEFVAWSGFGPGAMVPFLPEGGG